MPPTLPRHASFLAMPRRLRACGSARVSRLLGGNGRGLCACSTRPPGAAPRRRSSPAIGLPSSWRRQRRERTPSAWCPPWVPATRQYEERPGMPRRGETERSSSTASSSPPRPAKRGPATLRWPMRPRRDELKHSDSCTGCSSTTARDRAGSRRGDGEAGSPIPLPNESRGPPATTCKPSACSSRTRSCPLGRRRGSQAPMRELPRSLTPPSGSGSASPRAAAIR